MVLIDSPGTNEGSAGIIFKIEEDIFIVVLLVTYCLSGFV